MQSPQNIPNTDINLRFNHKYSSTKMPSSKGKPTDPELREQLKEEIKQEPNKSGGGVGQWSAWKGMKLAKEYEAQGGDYENEAGSKNEPKKGAPKAKSAKTKREEERAQESEPSQEE